jgi:hypothetical protein
MFRFEHVSEYNNQPKTIVNVNTDAVSLPEILGVMEDFLRGCGFHFDGRLDIVEEDT